MEQPVDTLAPPPSQESMIGKEIDRYRVIEKIGEGGMGAVYRVEHVMLKKHMAMKLLRFELSQNQELVTRFQNEAIAASRIGQENIVTVTDFGRTPAGLVYFVMEELQGSPLSVEIAHTPRFPIERALAIAAQSCRALHAAHTAGIIHRDLKPDNIILTNREGYTDFVKILDFGISKMAEQAMPTPDGARLTRAGMIVGTPEYMSPEQAAGGAVDARSDIYSLGIVMFEMLAGRLPFEADNPIGMLMRHQSTPVPAFAEAVDGLTVAPKFEQLIRKALSKQPAERQQSMAELLLELQDCAETLELTQPALMQPLSGPPLRSPSSSISGKSLPPRPLSDTRMTPSARITEDLESLKKKRSPVLGLVLLLLLGGVAFAGYAAFRSKPAAPISAPDPVPTTAELPKLEPPPTKVDPPPPAHTPVPTPEVAKAQAPRPVEPPRSHPHPARPAQTSKAERPSAPPANDSKPPADPYGKIDELRSPY